MIDVILFSSLAVIGGFCAGFGYALWEKKKEPREGLYSEKCILRDQKDKSVYTAKVMVREVSRIKDFSVVEILDISGLPKDYVGSLKERIGKHLPTKDIKWKK